MSRNTIYSLDLSPRPNVHQRESPLRDVLEICAVGLLIGLLVLVGYLLVVGVMV